MVVSSVDSNARSGAVYTSGAANSSHGLPFGRSYLQSVTHELGKISRPWEKIPTVPAQKSGTDLVG